VALLGIALLVTGCSSSGSSPTSADPLKDTSAAPATTPSGNVGGETSEPAATATTQGAVVGSIIDTPPEVLAGTKVAPSGLTNDYKPAPTDRSLVLTAAVPSVDIFESATSTTPTSQMANPIASGSPLTFLVDGLTTTRYKVLLPIRPNGSTGWVNAAQVTVLAHQYKVTVELSAHEIIVTNADQVIMKEKIGVGKATTPTPGGRYYIKELIRPCYSDGKGGKCVQSDAGPYGPYAYGLSGFSPVLDDYKGGRGEIGIHGTNEPEKIGTDVSHGCIRMANDSIRKLAAILPLGTPVIVQA
jgi:lipoprotein-anchoring transpeptidase ErfK/SrfK